MPNEKGYVMILTLVIVCMMTISTAILANRTFYASALTMRRLGTIQAYQLAESGALEAFWRLLREPNYRQGATKTLTDTVTGFAGTYTYQIIDATPDSQTDDLQLEIKSTGICGRWKQVVRLILNRPTTSSRFTKSLWQEDTQ